MRRALILFSLLCLLALPAAAQSTGHIKKVLPFLLDLQGRHALSPSLYDRDAYQDFLHHHPEKCSGLQFAVLCKVHASGTNMLKLRVEMRGAAVDGKEAFETTLELGHVSNHWATLTITGDDFVKLGSLTAWRISLWDGDNLLDEMKSFLWTAPGYRQQTVPPPSQGP